MNDFLEAIAQSLRNLGFDDACSDGTAVILRDVRFELRVYRRSFQFCGRNYRSGNVKHAVLDLIQQLPGLLLQRDGAIEAYRQDERRRLLNKELKDKGLSIEKVGVVYQLRYTAGLEQLETIARQIVDAETISLAPIDSMLQRLSATFTSEGGFSLN